MWGPVGTQRPEFLCYTELVRIRTDPHSGRKFRRRFRTTRMEKSETGRTSGVGRSIQSVYYGTIMTEPLADRPPGFLFVPLAAGILAYCGLFAAFYPPIAGIEDEQGFVNQAIFWAHGGLSAEAAGLPTTLGDLVEVDGRHLPARHPGRSLVALPFYLLGGYDGIFASGALLHVVLTLLAAATFRRLGLSPWWALAVLFHPTLLIYSRTVMGDAPAGLGLLVAVWALSGSGRPTTRDLVAAGLGVSLAAAMRHHAVAALPVIAAAAGWRCRSLRAAVCVCVAAAIGAIPLVVFNLTAYGSISDPFSAGRGTFGVQYLRDQLPFYSESLNLFWPLMFFAPFLARGPAKGVILGICGTFLALLGCYYFHDTTASRVQTDIIGLRLMQVALPAWLIGYGAALARISGDLPGRFRNDRRIAAGLAWAAVVLGTVLTTGIFVQHQRRLIDLDQRRREILRQTPAGGFVMYEGVVSKLMGIHREDQPQYQFHMVTFMGMYSYTPHEIRAAIASGQPAYLIFSVRNAGEEPTKYFTELVEKLDGEPVPSQYPLVKVWKPRRNLPDER